MLVGLIYREVQKANHWLLWAKKAPNISQSSVVTYLRCGGIFNQHLMLLRGERILNISQHLPKL